MEMIYPSEPQEFDLTCHLLGYQPLDGERRVRPAYSFTAWCGELKNKMKRKLSHTTPAVGEPILKVQKLHSDNGIENDGRNGGDASSQKLANLIQAIGEMFITEENMHDIRNLVGNDTFKQIEVLKHHLDMRAMLPLQDGENNRERLEAELPRLVSQLNITPWTVAEIPSKVPVLPVILDPVLYAAAFTHRGCGQGTMQDLNYERLEWVGDAYIYLLSTLLISKTFPNLLPGKCTQLRELLVKNVTLAQYTLDYEFEKRAFLPDNIQDGPSAISDTELTKIYADMFEAYVAAVIISDPVNGLDSAMKWLKQVWSRTLEREIRHEERGKIGRVMYNVGHLWSRNRADKGKTDAGFFPRERNPKEELRALIGSKGVVISYKDAAPEKKSKETKMPVFTVGCYLDGWGEKDKHLGFGRGSGKKEAGMKAAQMALDNKKLMKVYIEKKRVFDKQLEAERETLGSQKKQETHIKQVATEDRIEPCG